MMQGISTALSALYASQKAIDTTGNNIANVNTEGYTRQRVDMSPAGASSISFWGSPIDVGTGVTIEQIARLRDQFAERQSITENGKQGTADRMRTTFSSIEDAFGEPGDTGIQSQMADFFASWDDIVSESSAQTMLGAAETLVLGFQRADAALSSISDNAVVSLKNDIAEINTLARSIADLNSSIQTISGASGNANNLLDQRDQLARQLSSLVGVTTSTDDNGVMTVSVGGSSLVRGSRATALEVDDTTIPVVVRWDDKDNNMTTGNVATISGGDIKGLIDTVNSVVPRYRSMLDGAASSLAVAVNAQHSAGYDMNGDPGVAFFTGTTAADIGVNASILSDPKLIALASSPVGGTNDNANAQAIAAIAEAVVGPAFNYRTMITTLGTESQRAIRTAEIQSQITSSANSSRISVSGVNLDEEMTNLIQFQHSYSAAAKYLSTLNQVLDSLLGIVR